MRQFYLLLLFSAAGCLAAPDRPDEYAASSMVWQGYGLGGNIPSIEFMEGDCWPNADGSFHGWHLSATYGGPRVGRCDNGAYWPGWKRIQLLQWPGETWAESPLAHELWHARMDLVTGDPDQDHADPGFRPGGAVEAAKIALATADL